MTKKRNTRLNGVSALSCMAGMLLVSNAITAIEFDESFNGEIDFGQNVRLVDFDLDGNLDMVALDISFTDVIGNGNPSVAYQFSGNGDGSFSSFASIDITSHNTEILPVLDLNGDGLLDLIHREIYPGFTDSSFLAGKTIPTPLALCSKKLFLDINSDGLPDVICSYRRDTGFETEKGFGFAVYVNQGGFDLTLSQIHHSKLPGPKSPRSIELGDVNGDSLLDVVQITANTIGENNGHGEHVISTYLAQGSTFAEPIEWTTNDLHDVNNPWATTSVQFVELADFNGDTILDVVALVSGFQSTPDAFLAVYTGEGNGRFNTNPIRTLLGNKMSATQLVVEDMDGDGNTDILISYLHTGVPDQRNITLSLGLGDGTFSETQEVAPEHKNVKGIDIADVNGDGHLDIAAVTGWENGNAVVFTQVVTSEVQPETDTTSDTETTSPVETDDPESSGDNTTLTDTAADNTLINTIDTQGNSQTPEDNASDSSNTTITETIDSQSGGGSLSAWFLVILYITTRAIKGRAVFVKLKK